MKRPRGKRRAWQRAAGGGGESAASTRINPSALPAADEPPEEAQLPPLVAASMRAAGFERPTAVQAACWPACAAGRDVVCLAPTGSGKTLACALPLLDRIACWRAADASLLAAAKAAGAPLSLYLCPSRELAQQVAQACASMGAFGVTAALVHGGAARPQQASHTQVTHKSHTSLTHSTCVFPPFVTPQCCLPHVSAPFPPPRARPQQLADARRAELLIATPGRLLDLVGEIARGGGGGEGGGGGGGR